MQIKPIHWMAEENTNNQFNQEMNQKPQQFSAVWRNSKIQQDMKLQEIFAETSALATFVEHSSIKSICVKRFMSWKTIVFNRIKLIYYFEYVMVKP